MNKIIRNLLKQALTLLIKAHKLMEKEPNGLWDRMILTTLIEWLKGMIE